MEEKPEYQVHEEKPKKQKLVTVKVLKVTPHTALVEWQNGELRQLSYVATACLVQDSNGYKVAANDLDEGMPASLPFEKIIKPRQVNGVEFAKALQAAGIFTMQDLMEHSRELPGIVASVYGVEMSSILQSVEAYVTGKPGKEE